MSKPHLAPDEADDNAKILSEELANHAHENVIDDEDLPGRPDPGVPNDSMLRAEVMELTSDLQRLQAEFANYKRREADAKSALMDMAKQDVVLQLLPLLDNIDRALGHRPDELKDNAWAGGVEQVGKQVPATLQKLGIERIDSVGQPFDHNLHEAIGFDDGEGDLEVVSEELQPGYRLGDRVIRHAMVKVSKTSKKGK